METVTAAVVLGGGDGLQAVSTAGPEGRPQFPHGLPHIQELSSVPGMCCCLKLLVSWMNMELGLNILSKPAPLSCATPGTGIWGRAS